MGKVTSFANHRPLGFLVFPFLLLSVPGRAETSCALKVEVQRIANNGTAATVDPVQTTFVSGDQIRLRCETPRDGYLYVVQQGSSGSWSVLYPAVQKDSRQPRSHVIPEEGESPFTFDFNPGEEHLLLIASAEPVDLAGLAERLNGSPIRQVGHETKTFGSGTVRPRDLVFERDEAKPTSSAIAACVKADGKDDAGPVIAHVALTHTGESSKSK